MRLYTGSGDKGETGLIGGSRVPKDHVRVNTFGHLDELNASLGWVVVACEETVWRERIEIIQDRLFVIGAELANPDAGAVEACILPEDIKRLEGWIDAADEATAPLKQFILPGGCELGARMHLARAVCRRAERMVVGMTRECEVSVAVVIYLNRLADLLFAWARYANELAGVGDVAWRGLKSSQE